MALQIDKVACHLFRIRRLYPNKEWTDFINKGTSSEEVEESCINFLS